MFKQRFPLIAAALLLICVPFTSFASKGARKILPEAEFKAATEKQWGRILDDSEVPKLRQALAAPLARLQKVLKDVSKDRIGINLDLPTEVWIHDSTRANAYMNVVETPAGEKKAVWTFTTGIAKAYFDYFPGQPDRAIKALIGIMAHEIAHTFDVFDPKGFEESYRYKDPDPILDSGIKVDNPNEVSQAIELRTDIEAVNLLREAQLQDDSLLEGLTALEKILNPKGEKGHNPAFLYFSSHPDDQMRLSAQRIALTALRYKRGDKELIHDSIPTGVEDEIKGVQLPPEKPSVTVGRKEPTTILETVAAFDELFSNEVPAEWKDGGWLEFGWKTNKPGNFSALFNHLNKLLIERGSDLSSAEEDAVLALHMKILDPSSNFPENLSRSDEGTELFKKVPFYQTDKYKNSVAEAAQKYLKYDAPKKAKKKKSKAEESAFREMGAEDRPTKGIKALQNKFDRFAFLLPHEALIPVTGDALAAALIGWMDSEPDKSMFAGLEDFASESSYGNYFSPFFHQKVLPNVKKRARNNWFSVYSKTGVYEEVSPINFRYDAESSLKEVSESRKKFLESLDASQKEQYKAIAERIWKNRARLAIVDLVLKKHTDWAIVFELLGIAEADGNAELNHSVKEYTQTEGYPKFLKQLVRTKIVDCIFRPKSAPHFSLMPAAVSAACRRAFRRDAGTDFGACRHLFRADAGTRFGVVDAV